MTSQKKQRRPLSDAFEPIASTLASSGNTLSIVKEALLTPFHGEARRAEGLNRLHELVPQVISARSLTSAQAASRALGYGARGNQLALQTNASLTTRLGHYTTHLPYRQPAETATSLAILENIPNLLSLNIAQFRNGEGSLDQNGESDIPLDGQVSLIRGFKATIPTSELAKQRRRRVRGGVADDDLLIESSSGPSTLGLKRLGDRARGLLTEGEEQTEAELEEERSRARKARRRKMRKGRGGGTTATDLAVMEGLGIDELTRQVKEIAIDKDNLRVRKTLISAEIESVTAKIDALELIRRRLEGSMTRMLEEELELDDELEGVKEAMSNPAMTRTTTITTTSSLDPSSSTTTTTATSNAQNANFSSRRRRGPAFLPSEHDDLPKDVAFMTLSSHPGGITSLDFSEPYGIAVTSGQDELVRVWDLCDGEELGLLRGHDGMVKCVQVEGSVALTGGSDGSVRLWDLGRVEEWEESRREAEDHRRKGLDALLDQSADERLGDVNHSSSHMQQFEDHEFEAKEKRIDGDPCLRVLDGHSKAVTSLYYEDNCLVTGSNDKTVRQWDVNTGQCVLTMDILWAISNPPAMTVNTINPATTPISSPRRPGMLGRSSTYKHSKTGSFGTDYDPFDDPFLSSPGPGMLGLPGSGLANATTGQFAVPTPPFADGSWEMYQDFVGGVQFWGYALATGSGDGGVRMWDMRTGQAHRTLLGHMGPVTCLQFDESYIVSGSLDKTIRTWDLRTGAIVDTLKYDYPVTAVQFDSRKIVACTGENGVEVYNRTSGEHKRLVVNGHIKPAERMRFWDKYLVSGGKDGEVKVWSL